MTAFAYITGIATLLGLALQLLNVFPEYKETRKTIFLIITGIFFGNLIGVAQNTEVRIDINESRMPIGLTLILVILAVCLVILAVGAIVTNDAKKRDTILTTIFAFGGIYTVLVFFLSMLLFVRSPKDISTDELLYLSYRNEERGNLERSIQLLEDFKRRLHGFDPRKEEADKRIADIKRKQVRSQ